MTSCSGSYGSYCCVPWCQNNGRTQKKPGTCFFRIPQDSRSTAWVKYSRRADLAEKPVSLLYTSYKICSDHFTAQDFMNPGRTRLRKTAVPTVYPDSADVLSVGAYADTSPRYIVPEDHPEEAIYISSFMSENPAVRGYGYPVSEEQAGEDVLEETSENGSLMMESHVAEDSADVSPIGASTVTSPQYTAPDDHPNEAIYISCFMPEDPTVRGYGDPVNEEQAGEDVLEETSENGSLMMESHVAKDSADVSPVGASTVTSPQYTVPDDHPEEATYISCFMSEDPAVRGYGHPVSEEQGGKDVLEETAEKGSLMTESHVAKGSLQEMPGCNTPMRELGAAGCQVDMSGSNSTAAEHDAMSKMFASTSTCIRTAASSEGDFPGACNGAARKFSSKKFRKTYRFQSKVATYRRTITRLWKQQHKLPLSTLKTLSLIHSRVTKEVFKLLCAHMQLQQKDKVQLSGAHSCNECRRRNRTSAVKVERANAEWDMKDASREQRRPMTAGP
ncbi:uncharacterized protein [Dermacentor albipictus]|uniref:uncharacterized protein isoform X2 n=1 Tax=Dermacentor albipictus TaxID=60249 RepID=UPI0038FC7EFA